MLNIFGIILGIYTRMVYNIFNVTFEYFILNPCNIFVLYQFCILSVFMAYCTSC